MGQLRAVGGPLAVVRGGVWMGVLSEPIKVRISQLVGLWVRCDVRDVSTQVSEQFANRTDLFYEQLLGDLG